MAKRVKEICIAFVFAVMMFGAHHTSAQSTSCTTAIISLAPCLGYITGISSAPSNSCCSQLSSVVSNQAQAQCLCTMLNGGASSFGLTINQTQALTLLGTCNVNTSPVNPCEAPATPSTPTTTPASSTPTTPGSGSKTTPSTTTGVSSAGSSYKPSSTLLFSALFTAVSLSSLAVF